MYVVWQAILSFMLPESRCCGGNVERFLPAPSHLADARILKGTLEYKAYFASLKIPVNRILRGSDTGAGILLLPSPHASRSSRYAGYPFLQVYTLAKKA